MVEFYVNMPYAEATKNWHSHFHAVINADSIENALEKALPPINPAKFPNLAIEIPMTQKGLDEDIILAQYYNQYNKRGSEKFYLEIFGSEEVSKIQGQSPPKPVPGTIAKFLSYILGN